MRFVLTLPIVICFAPAAFAAADAPPWRAAVEERVVRLRSAGEPVDPAEVRGPIVPAERNAAPIVLAAGDLLIPPGRETRWSRGLLNALRDYVWPLTAAQRDEVVALLTEGAAALTELNRIEAAHGFDWGALPASPVAVPASKRLVRPRLRGACALLRLDALVALEGHDAARAWRRAGQLRQLADGLALRPGAGMLSDARLAEAMAAEVTALLCRPDALDEAALGGREAVRGVITTLLSEGPTPADVARHVRVERVVVIDALRALAEGKVQPEQLVGGEFVAGVLEDRGLLRVQPHLVVDYHTRLVEALDGTPSLERSVLTPRVADFHRAFAGEGFAAFRLAQGVGPNYSEYAATQSDRVGSRRLAAVVLATRLYRNDRGGALPASLDDLVPAYLPAVPGDPTSNEPATMRYRGEGADAMAWFAGENGKDDGGAEERPGMKPEERRATDRVARLKGALAPEGPARP